MNAAAGNSGKDPVVTERLLRLVSSQPDVIQLSERLQARASTPISGSGWERDGSTARAVPKDQRVVNLRRRLGRSFS
jgi:hypothetical protein